MEGKKPKLEAKSILKQSGKYLYNEDGTPVRVNGKYLYLKDDGSTSLLSHHPNYDQTEKDNEQATESEDAVEEMAVDLENTLDSLIAGNVPEPTSEDHQDSSADVGWDTRSTQLLLSLYKVMKELVDQRRIPTQKKMWIKMASRLQEHGYSFTPGQIENRYKTLLRSYRRKLETSVGLRKGRVGKDLPYEREMKEVFERDKRNSDVLVTQGGEPMTIADFLEATGLSGQRQPQFVAGTPRARRMFTLAPDVASKLHFKQPAGVSPGARPVPPSSPPYYTNYSRRPDVMEELRDLRTNTLEKLRTMEDKRDAFNEKVLQELRYRNELLEKLLEHVP